ncbi:MAG: translation initiation factor IF-6 [Methermicoccaceae archaeon]
MKYKTIQEKTVNFGGITSIGVFARCTEDYLISYPTLPKRVVSYLSSQLGVEVVRTTVCGSNVVGSMLSGNSKGFVVSHYCEPHELKVLEGIGSVVILTGISNAFGNMILMNDYGALVHPSFSDKNIERIEHGLGVDVRRGTIAGLKNVGMAAVATNKGVLAHPRITEDELAFVENILNVDVDVGTVSFGSPLVGAGILANSKGYVAGSQTSGFELGYIERALGFI